MGFFSISFMVRVFIIHKYIKVTLEKYSMRLLTKYLPCLSCLFQCLVKKKSNLLLGVLQSTEIQVPKKQKCIKYIIFTFGI